MKRSPPPPPHHHRQTRTEPNRDDPLSEPTVNRRIWAAYLQRGFNRSTWANALGMSYPSVDQIDIGKVTPKLETLIKMRRLLGTYSLDELAFGRDAPARSSNAELSDAQVRALLVELGAEVETADALGQHVASPSGRFMPLTRAYVSAFAQAFEAARAEQLDPRASIDLAKRTAINAQANAEAIEQGVRPVGRSQLAAAPRERITAPAPRKRKARS